MGNIGLDVKYSLTTNLTLDATINPDFGQVELDRPVLNLSSFETYYSEKRPFFLEGADLFNTDFNLFYSRRIGRDPGWIDDDECDEYSDRPKATTILGAAKISGKLSGGTSIAFLNAVTDEEKAKYITTSKEEREGVIEPKANYSVLRVKQDIFGNSNIGTIITLASQDTYHPAVTGGVDWRLFTNNAKWLFSGQSVFSRVDNENIGYGYEMMFSKESGKHVRGAFGYRVENPELSINRLGFLSSNNEKNPWLWMQYRTDKDWWIVRNSWHNINFYGSWTFENVNVDKGWNYNFYMEFTNNWSLGGGYNENYAEYDIWETRDNGLWERPISRSWWASMNTDQRKKISFNLNPGSGSSRYGTWWAHYTGIQYRPTDNMEFSGGINYNRSFGQTRWVENAANGRSIFADLDSDEISLNLTVSVMLTPALSWQISGQGIIAALDYNNYREYWGGEQYSDESTVFAYNPDINHDYNYTVLNSTMVLRWEYMPGSTLYLVWTRSRSEADGRVNNLEFSRDFDRFFSYGSENAFLIKASYWMNM